ncbi:serine hydrolase [Shewanella amazonensis]|uniref:Beta-lactamase class C-like protein n=1 Tax=Shewanella amazonensis (strain ATCC BAA-1098 / SB2B) TaxID=326297 RepID=A1S9R7_SHEAM|nr:serine hydrolase domain-containing protein [Shewanella amazonensis]ABM01124.1 beta-lactamase class C-like protein [Shewanella amazonensis SB2B]
MTRVLLAVLCSAAVLMSCGKKDTDTTQIDDIQSRQERLHRAFDDIRSQSDFMGSVVLMHSGKVIFSDSSGFDDISKNEKSTTHSAYLIGSVSKTYTAALVLKAVDEQKLTLEQTLEAFFPTLENGHLISIKNLLQHTSGIGNYTKKGKGFFDYRTENQSSESMLNRILALGSDFEPGTKAEYSNSNYYLLALILEKVYQKSFGEILSEKITTPLNLTQTVHVRDTHQTQHSYSFDNGQWSMFPASNMSVGLGAGSIKATPTEVAIFYNALFNGEIIPLPLVDTMKQTKNGFGLGIKPIDFFDKQGFGHGGTFDAYNAMAAYFPQEKMTLVLASNGSNDNFHDTYQQMLKSYFNQTLTDLPVAAEELARYVGQYQAIPDDPYGVTLINLDGKLANQFPDGYTQALRYEGDGRFVYDQVGAEPVYFIISDNGDRLSTRLGEKGEEEVKMKVVH